MSKLFLNREIDLVYDEHFHFFGIDFVLIWPVLKRVNIEENRIWYKRLVNPDKLPLCLQKATNAKKLY